LTLRIDPRVPIAVATRNADKFREIAAVWGDRLPLLMPAGDEYPDVDERFDTYEENAVLKARALAQARGGPALADDSGIEVEDLDWQPGVRSARTPSPDSTPQERNADLLRRLASILGSKRRARYVCACAVVVPGHEPLIARGEVEGLIADAQRGCAGFGYDPIFFYPPFGCTFGEIDGEKKNAVSHRGNAVRALLQN
jgi:XTP/dITP diphosphohydrolase